MSVYPTSLITKNSSDVFKWSAMNFLSFSFELMINRRSPRLSTISVDSDTEASSTASSLVSLVVPFVDSFTATLVVPCGPIKFELVEKGFPGVALSLLSLKVPLEDAELFKPVRLWSPVSLMNTFTSPVGVDLHPLTIAGYFLFS